MNKQEGPNRIEWTDFTWNPMRGCLHGCEWTMPDGQTAECYAKTIADQTPKLYPPPDRFRGTQFLADKLDEPKHEKKHAKIFSVSMGDGFGLWNSKHEIDQVFRVVKYCYWLDFQFLTKNAPRYKAWDSFPVNAWMGASVPPSRMNGQTFSEGQQKQMLFTTLGCLKDTNATIKWMSVEPLAWDAAPVFDRAQPKLDWIVIGAATSGHKVYQPRPEWITDLIEVLRDQGTRIFFKGNLRGNPAAATWLEEMPAKYVARRAALEQPTMTQASLF